MMELAASHALGSAVFAVFVALMLVLLGFVIRFARQTGRRR
jgi:hypothetical protein